MNAPAAPALAEALRQAILAQRFDTTPDRLCDGAPVEAFPSIDLAVLRWAGGGRSAMAANVLFSREHPHGVVARFGAEGGGLGPVANLRFDADVRDAAGTSVAWQPGADWARIAFPPLLVPAGLAPGAPRFVAPYPASLLKLMVAVGLGLAVDAGRLGWAEVMPELTPMITVSDNDATDRAVALLHRAGVVDTLNRTLQQAWGLPTLQLNRTTPQGGWRNGDGSGVGQIHMTAWDTVRLLWILDPQAPPAPWLAPGTPTLAEATKRRLLAALAAQELDEILSSGRLRGLPGWQPGLPDAPQFAHKTGTTENYASDAGIVATPDGLHYGVAVLSNLGSRYRPRFVGADDDRAATTWKLPALGAAVHALMQSLP
ncbi:MAG: serine hydrolase [Betaproteobacteria bacterium]|nr:serine hydrolase [Rubrivivax sp.]